jgi:ASC-1-like (ASCH) protein
MKHYLSEAKKMSVDNDQTDSMAKNARGTVEAAINEEKLCAMIEQLDSNDNNVVNMILADSDINQIFHGNKSEMQRIEDTRDTTIKEADSSMAKNAGGTVEAATSEEKLGAMIQQLDSNDYNVVNMILTDSAINQIFHGNKSEMQQIEDTPDNTIKEADSNEIQKASFLS